MSSSDETQPEHSAESSPETPPTRAVGPRGQRLLPFTFSVLGLALLVGLVASPMVARNIRLSAAQKGSLEDQLEALDRFLQRYPDDEGGLAALGAIRTWREVQVEQGPTPRTAHAMTDAPRGQLVLFGGTGELAPPLRDTWTWDGKRWTRRNPASEPSARRAHAMAFDASRNRVVLFGGEDASDQDLGDTWEWDGSTWKRLETPTAPPARSSHAMSWDEARGVIVLFGGEGDGADLGDTWTFSGREWAQVPVKGPLERHDHALAFDAARGVTLLYGGRSAGRVRADTWTWSGSSWTQPQPATSPPALAGHRMAYDPARETVVLFGGFSAAGSSTNATWEWGGERWQQRRPEERPRERAAVGMTFDPRQGLVVFFGGSTSGGAEPLDDMWSYGRATGYR